MPHFWDTMDGRKAVSFTVLYWLMTVCHGRGRYYGTEAQLMHMGWTRHRGAWRRSPQRPGSFHADPRQPVQVSEARPEPDKLPRFQIAIRWVGRTVVTGLGP